MLIALILYILWVIGFIAFGDQYFVHGNKALSKMILVAGQLVFLFIIWRLWRRLILAAKEEQK